MEGLVFLVGAGVVVALVIIFSHFEKKRKERLLRFAKENGYEFYPAGDPTGAQPQGCSFSMIGKGYGGWFSRFEGFHPFGQGSSRSARNLFVKREDEGTWYFFDYSYSTGSGKNRTTHYYWIGVFEHKAYLPSVRIRSENVFDKIGAFVGFRDIEFESEEFNRAFHVSSSEEKFAYAVVNPKMMEFLMQGWGVDWQLGGSFLLIADNGRLDIDKLGSASYQMQTFLEQIPEYVWEDYEGFR